MASGKRILVNGKRVLTSVGRQVLQSVLVACSRCINCLLGNPRVCGSDSTCNKWCFPWRKDYSQSECCDCPCPGRKGLPPGYSWDISGVTLLGGRQPASTLATNVDYYTVSNVGPFSFDECTTSHSFDVLFEREFRNPDGSIDHIDSSTQTWTIGGGVTVQCVLCPDGQTSRAIRASAFVELSGQPNGIDAHFPRKSLVEPDRYTLDGETDVSCCITSPDFTILVDNNADVNLPADAVGFVVSGGTFQWRPTCVDCSDVPLQTDDGDPASICASDLNYYIEYFDGVDWIPESGTLVKGACFWSGGTALQIAVATTALNGASCPDNCDCNTCTDGIPDCSSCQTNWILSVTRTVAYSEFMSTGACPPTGFRGLDGVNFRNLTLTFGTNCQ